MPDMSYDFTKFKKSLSNSEEWVKKEFTGIRTGQANPALLDSMNVRSLGSIMTEGPRMLRITPWDTGAIKEIEKTITMANLGVSVSVDEKGLRVNFPDLTAERRVEIVKIAKDRLEEGKKQIRIHRDEIMKDLKAKQKSGAMGEDEAHRHEKKAQKLVDEHNKKLEEFYVKKEKEIKA